MLARGAKAVILNPRGEVLIVRRSSTHLHAPLTNDIPGGKVEPGETMREGLVREIQEEVGIDVTDLPLQLIGSRYFPDYYGREYTVELYLVQLTESVDITLSFEHDQYDWVPLAEASIVAKLFEEMFTGYVAARTAI